MSSQPGRAAGPHDEPSLTRWVKSYDGKSYTRRAGSIRAEVCRDDRHLWVVTLTAVAFQFGDWISCGPGRYVGRFDGPRLAKREGDAQLALSEAISPALPAPPCICVPLHLPGSRDRIRVPHRTCPAHGIHDEQ